MEDLNHNLSFYMSANAPNGFFSYCDDITSAPHSRMYILKGGPGTGKSSLMKKIAAAAQTDHEVELIYCSSDPDSLDALIIKDLSVIMIDGTAPHVVDPTYPGAVDEIINLGAYWNNASLVSQKEDIIRLTTQYKMCFEQAYHYLAAAKKFRDDSTSIILGAVHYERLHKLTKRIIKKELRGRTGETGVIKKRFLSGIGPKGVYPLFDGLPAQDYRVYQLNDAYHIAVDMLREIAKTAADLGLTAYTCYCPFSPDTDIEHVLIPELRLAFVTSNHYHPYPHAALRTINLSRYLEPAVIKLRRARLRFNTKMTNAVLDSAIAQLREAKKLHDALEEIYIGQMQFRRINALTKTLMDEIQSFAP